MNSREEGKDEKKMETHCFVSTYSKTLAKAFSKEKVEDAFFSLCTTWSTKMPRKLLKMRAEDGAKAETIECVFVATNQFLHKFHMLF